MKKCLLIPIILGFSVITILLLFYSQKNKTPNFGQPENISVDEVAPEARDTQYMLNHLIRGSIVEQTNNTITLKEDQFITTGKEIELKVSPSQEVFCWPSKKNGIDIKKSLLTLPEGSNLYMTEELETTFANLANLLGKYALVQIDEQGAISKLVVISCFDD